MSAVLEEETERPEFIYTDISEVTERALRKHEAFLSQQLGLVDGRDRGSTLIKTTEALKSRPGPDGIKVASLEAEVKVLHVTVTSLNGTFVLDTFLTASVDLPDLRRRLNRVQV
ncbi:MAG: hypothetical protein WCO03_01060 [bacterium]